MCMPYIYVFMGLTLPGQSQVGLTFATVGIDEVRYRLKPEFIITIMSRLVTHLRRLQRQLRCSDLDLVGRSLIQGRGGG